MLDRFVTCKPHGGEAVAALSGGMQANTWNVGTQAGQLRWQIIDELLQLDATHVDAKIVYTYAYTSCTCIYFM